MEWKGLGVKEEQKTGRRKQGNTLWNLMENMMIHLEDNMEESA